MNPDILKLIEDEKANPPTPNAITTLEGEALSSPVTQVDPDTVKVGDQSYRLQGFNAPETAKFQGGIFVPGQVAGDRTGEIVNAIAQQGGFTNLESTGKKDPYGRVIAKQTNKAGENLGDIVTALGITDPNLYTEDKVISDNRMARTLMRVMPGMAKADPVMKLAMEEHERRVKEAGGSPLYRAKLTARDEAQYAAAKSIVGISAVKEQLEEIDRLSNILQDPNLRADTRIKLEKDLESARDKLFVAGTTPDFVGGVNLRQGDRTILNKAYNQLETSFDNGVLDLKKGLYGFGALVGDEAKWDWLSEKSRSEVTRIKQIQSDLPTTLNSIKDVPASNDWQTIENAATYVGNLLAGTLPMMSALVASTIATAPIGGIGGAALSTIPGSILYSGQFYADQDEEKKNSLLALSAGISSAVLDRLGLEAMLGGGNLFSQIGRKEIMAKMMQTGLYASEDAAEAALKQATKAELVAMSGAGADFAAKHYASKEARLAALKAFGLSTLGEAGTESTQTVLEMVARSGEIDPDMRYEKHFYTSILDAAIGGGIMGGTFNVGQTALDMAQWHSAADAVRAYEGNLNDAQAYQEEQRQRAAAGDAKAATSVLEAISKSVSTATSAPEVPLEALAGKPGVWNGMLAVMKDPVRMLRSLADTTVQNLRRPDGTLKHYLPILKSIMAPGILTGDAFDGFRQRIIGEWSTTPAEVVAHLLRTDADSVSRLLRDAWQSTWSKGERLDVSDPRNEILQNWMDEALDVTDQAQQVLADTGFDMSSYGSLNAIFEEAAIDPRQLAKNAQRVIDVMVENESGLREATEAVNAIISGNPAVALPAKGWMSRHGVFRDPRLNDLFEPNIFSSFENFKHRVATNAAQEIYLGRDGKNLAKIIQLAKENGEFESEEQYLDTIQNTKDFYQIAIGKYNTLENYPFIEKILGWGVTATMLASLGKAAISSIPEAALSTLGTRGEKVTTQLKNAATEFFNEYRSDINKGISWSSAYVGLSYARNHPNGRILEEAHKIEQDIAALGPNPTEAQSAEIAKRVKRLHKKMIGRNLFDRLGYNDSGYNTQAKFETSTSNMKAAMQVFASAIGLRAMTDATRIATLSMAGDIVRVRLSGLQAIPRADRRARFSTGEGMSNEQFQSLKELQRYGMDVERVLDIMDGISLMNPLDNPVDKVMESVALGNENYMGKNDARQILKDNFLITIRNMVDGRIVNPQIGNLPKYYHDPKLRIFTAMTRFIAGLTANVLPRLYKDYIKDGSAGMRYQAFSVMAMAVVFAHFANMLKDILSYGDDENPYLKGKAKAAQRNLYGSGLLGRAEGIVDTFAPLYPNRTPDPFKSPIAAAYNTFKGNAPPVNWADRAVRAMYQLSTGDTEKGTKNAVRSLPLIGSFPIAAETAANLVKE